MAQLGGFGITAGIVQRGSNQAGTQRGNSAEMNWRDDLARTNGDLDGEDDSGDSVGGTHSV